MATLAASLHDETLPHLSLALDGAAMASVLQTALLGQTGAEGQLRIRDCEIERVRYKPGQNCLVCYHLQIENSAGQPVGEQRLSARLYEAGGSRRRFVRAQKEPPARPSFGPPLLHIPKLDMVAWVFPNDRKLRGLHSLTDSTTLRYVLLPPLIARHFGSDWRIAGLAHELAHYNPEHTAMVRVQLQLENWQTGQQQPYLLYGKTYYDGEGAETYRIMRQLWQRPAPRLPHIPQPLAYQPDLNLLWQHGLIGQTLLALEMGSRSFMSRLAQAAAAVAALHQTPLTVSRSYPLESWIARLKEMRQWLPAILPGCRPALEPLVDRLLAQAARVGPQPTAILHGDLHLQNFFLHGPKVALIDLDNVYGGSPWQDIGSFIASLHTRSLLLGTPGPLIQAMADAFYLSYCQDVPWQATRQELNWFIAAALINERAFRCVTRLKDGRLDLVHTLIELAAEISGDEPVGAPTRGARQFADSA